MVDVTLVCFAALVAATPGQVGSAAGPSGAIGGWQVSGMADAETPPPLWKPAANFDEVVIRAQNGSPFYEELGPADGGGGVPQYPYSGGAPAFSTPGAVPGNPPALGGAPYAAPSGGFGPAPAQYDPFVGPPPGAAPPGAGGQIVVPGVTGAEPYRFGPTARFDFGYITPADADNGYGSLHVFEFDSDLPIVSPQPNGDVFTFTPQFDMRQFSGPSSPPGMPGFPNDLYRFGWDFEYALLNPTGRWSGVIGFNPSINTDFERPLSMTSVNWDGRAVAFYQASPTLKVALGVLYYDRVTDRLLPYAGVIVTPSDRLELRLVFPEPRIEYFLGHSFLGKPTWVYARGEYHIEAWEVEVPAGRHNQLQVEDYRFLIGARKDQGWGQTFLEAGYVFNRSARYASGAPGFNMGDAWIFRGGVRF
jgi:hypothetical protein